jgi:hypothetical protein
MDRAGLCAPPSAAHRSSLTEPPLFVQTLPSLLVKNLPHRRKEDQSLTVGR